MASDLISKLFSHIQNALAAQNTKITIQYSEEILAIVKALFKEGLIKSYLMINNPYKQIEIELRYIGRWIKKPILNKIFRVSKPGRRVYIKSNAYRKLFLVSKIKNYLFFISTSSGIMSHLQASKCRKGGEIICCIY